MNKILLVGKLNSTTKELYGILSRRFQVQVTAEKAELVKNMVLIVDPDMVLLNVMELEDIEEAVFDTLKDNYKDLPVLVLGTQEASDKYREYFSYMQFRRLIRPVSKELLIRSCYQLLGETEISGEAGKVQNDAEDQKNILIVDDSPVTLRGIKAMLDKDYQIAVATSGEQALKTMKKKRPDLVLLDYEMPGWDGRETLERIRQDEELSDIPVVFLTGVADKEHIAAVLKLNPAGYFLKPAERDKLMATIDQILHGEIE